ncbi:MAG: HupE/UreJ family protein [Pseudomonadota bacterium]
MSSIQPRGARLCALMILLIALGAAAPTLGHGVDDGTRDFLSQASGLLIGPFLYIGAKHMVTGYDHLLFLFGVMFLLVRGRDVLTYVTLFTLGHSATLLLGVLTGLSLNAYLVDAVIGLSVLYKGFDNLGGFPALGLPRPEPKLMVALFGLVHGFGLATKLQDFELPREHLFGNLVAFNVGVEIGQLLALGLILAILNLWRRHRSFTGAALLTNTLLMSAGVVLIGLQLGGYFFS